MARRIKIAQPDSLDADELYARLAVRYALPEWGIFRQVCEAGTGGERYADAIAFNLFPSRGLEVHGFEIKVSRSDWLREKRDPAKADVLARFCDRWWVVAGAPEIVGIGELPPTWGLILPRGDGLVTKVEAPKVPAQEPTRALLATVVRRMQADDSYSWDAQINRAVLDERRRLQAEHEKQLEKAAAPLHALEEALGMKVGHIDFGPNKPQDVGRALRLFLQGKADADEARADLARYRRTFRRMLKEMDEALGPEPDVAEVANG